MASKNYALEGTKWIIMNCPGNKVPIRSEPKVDAETIGFATSGDKFEVYKRTTAGFWKILNEQVYNYIS